MAIVNGLSKERMLEIEAQSVVDGEIVNRHLILTRHDGTTTDAGDVVGPPVALVMAPKPVTDLPSTYPYPGVSTFTFGAETTGWPAVLGTVFSYIENNARGFQIVTEKATGATANMWIRVVGQDTWGPFMKLVNTDASGFTTLFKLRLTGTTDASETSTDHAFQIGPTNELNISIDSNEILGRNNGALSPVYFNSGLRTPIVPAADDDVMNKAAADITRYTSLLQRLMTGGGIRKVDSTGISWSQRLIVMGLGRWIVPNGYYQIEMPPDGTVIPVYGGSAGTSVTVAGGKIPLQGWRALYYEIPWGTSAVASKPENFRLMDYNLATTQGVPSNWILIATRNLDSMVPQYLWGDGVRQDYWKTLTLKNSWTAYNTAFPAPAWRFTAEGKVETHGLMKGGTVGLATPFATLPYPELAPDGVSPASGSIFITTASAGPGTARLDVMPDGNMSIISLGVTGSTNGYISLDNLSWHPAGH
jgi:hypothetical protein